MDWRGELPMRGSDDGDENDFEFDDGAVWFFCTVDGNSLVIHDLAAIDPAMRRARSGLGRRTCERLRPYFGEIVAAGVGEPDEPLEQQKPFLFWKAMLDEGLVDEIRAGFHDRIYRREAVLRP